MKATVVGIVHRKGIAKKSGNPYDFAVCKILTAISTSSSENMQVKAHGFQEAEIAAEPSCVEKFAGLKLPGVYELETDSRVNNYGQLELVVVGVRQ